MENGGSGNCKGRQCDATSRIGSSVIAKFQSSHQPGGGRVCQSGKRKGDPRNGNPRNKGMAGGARGRSRRKISGPKLERPKSRAIGLIEVAGRIWSRTRWREIVC